MITKRIPPTVSDPVMNRLIQQIYRDMNEIIDSLGKYQTSLPSTIEGREGDVRITKQGENDYIVSIRSADGWVNSLSGTFTIQKGIE